MYRLSSIILMLFLFASTYAQSPHGDKLKVSCNECHNPSGWEMDVYLMRFDHSKTEFKLEGAHTQTDCKSCHTTLVFNEAPNQCASCHDDMHSASVGNDCVRCHTSNTWLVDDIPEIHEENGFPLIGSHGNLSCVDCHSSETNLRFDNVGNDCISCHRDDYLATESPDHTNFSTDCIECHNPVGIGWDTDNVGDHDFFPLTQGHDNLDCVQCHTTDDFADADPNCISCHQPDYNETSNPSHNDVGFSTDCASCHTTNPGWTPATIDHDFFPLTLGHDIQDCTQCHTTANYSDADPNCVSCHQTTYDGTTNPNHNDVGYSTDCASCHTTNPGWTPATIDHDFFPLTLGHDIQDCTQCHTTANYSDADSNCVSCHQTTYDGTTNPNHNDVGYSTDCASCHTTNPGWTPATVDHDFFPLTLGHDIQDCTQCHTTGNYSDADPNCVSCHQTTYDGTTNPNHNDVGYSTDCASCHTTNPGWTPATVDHDFFPLTLGHDIQDCTQCHTTANYSDADPNCVSCHQTTYDGTTNPNHNDVGYSTDCVSCHTTNPGWTPATVDHDFFPLTLGHDIQDCTQCHTTANYSDADPNCVSCHQTEYDGSTDPSHIDAQFPTDCVTCHTTNPNWTPVTWDHNDFYPLNGAHASIASDCLACHSAGYENTPNTCVGCHQTDYDSTTNPNHSSAQFPTDCIECHTETAWEPSTFDHDGQYFPIYSGKHQGEWDQCIDCHNDPNNYTVFNCLNCHEHDDQNQVDNDHDHPDEPEFDGYIYESNACFSCHPNPQ